MAARSMSGMPRSRMITTECAVSGRTWGSCASRVGALAKNRLPCGCSTTTLRAARSVTGSASRTPSGPTWSCRSRTRLEYSATNSTMPSPMPVSTANCSGIRMVRVNVTAITAVW